MRIAIRQRLRFFRVDGIVGDASHGICERSGRPQRSESLQPHQMSPQRPQAEGLPEHAGSSDSDGSWVGAANTDNFLVSRVDPQTGQRSPFQSVERTSNSHSFPHRLH